MSSYTFMMGVRTRTLAYRVSISFVEVVLLPAPTAATTISLLQQQCKVSTYDSDFRLLHIGPCMTFHGTHIYDIIIVYQ